MKTAVLAAALFSAGAVATTAGYNSRPSCKCFPGEACWPSASAWRSLNSTVGGRLIETVPLAKVCHNPDLDAAQCQALQDRWQFPDMHMSDSASIMAPFFANQSCDPFTPASTPCTLGNYVRYAVAAASTDDVIKAISFAKRNNIRFVIRNTGHDYLARSTGAGALSIWTHKLKSIQFKTWRDSFYTGTAVKVGAGVQGFEILAAAKARGQVAVTGECSTVGLAGGYTQGGGHSALSTSFGLSADNTLEFEVITASGQLLTASRTRNPDLYWALSGGGGGNYGVVVSLTVKTFPDRKIGGASLSFFAHEVPTESFYAAIDAFHAALPAMVDAGSMVVYYFTSTFFMIAPLTAYDKSEAEVRAIMAPFVATLTAMNVTHNAAYSETANYWDHYNTYFGPLPNGAIQIGIAQYGGRLVPRRTITNNASATALAGAGRFIAEQGVTWIGVGTDVSRFGARKSNSVLPAWRDALVHVTLTTPWSFEPSAWGQMLNNQDFMTNTIMPAIEAVTPGSGAYMNEADFRQPNFQQEFFGSSYNTLLSIKKKYDPESFFYATKAVGSERWNVANDGKMCRA
ncbi:putative isoamyl alcohol oxidase [Cercophora newfieldiana]|uniref:Isoamyl alcohol oxidase n=1 Tax=Cercophora newfieldiana TaxID=92897 RepID=A0AA40CUB2_9PEZI|nr:putative isoamyl alcohol oxidase [Cercophora newfieldiana]